MLQDQHSELFTHGFLVAVEASHLIRQQDLSDHIADALQFIEGVGKVEIDWLGEWQETKEAPEAAHLEASPDPKEANSEQES